MPRGKKAIQKKNSTGVNLGFEEKLWQAADKMRGHMDPAERKTVPVKVSGYLLFVLPSPGT